MAVKGNISIHTENILPIIKKWMYSDTEIFVRELVSNAFDAWAKLLMVYSSGEFKGELGSGRIDIKIDAKEKTLTISDNGIGMTEAEIDKYINQIAFSSAEEFIEKYKKSGKEGSTSEAGSDVIIGHFGLGFYSSFMVSEYVEIDSLSYQEGAKAAHWKCSGNTEFEITEGQRTERGTTIVLYINSENEEFLEENKVKEIIKKYCNFLPLPIYLNETHVNTDKPIWLKNPAELQEKDYLDFYEKLYPSQEAPVFWLHLNLEYPFNLKGILYFPTLHHHLDASQGQIRLYSNQVFVSDNCKQIIPDFLNMLQGVLDSPDIPLNVSRSYLQSDRQVKQISSHIVKKVADRLNELHTDHKEKYEEHWKDIGPFLKFGALQEDKFYDRVKNIILFKNTSGAYTNIFEYITRYKEKKEYQKEKHGKKVTTVYYAKPEEEEASSYLTLFKEQGIEVLFTEDLVDPHFIHRVEMKEDFLSFSRIDSEVIDSLIDKEREDTLLDSQGRTKASRIGEFVKKVLKKDGLEVKTQSLKSENIPALITSSEFSRRFQEMSTVFGKKMDLPLQQELVLNTNHAAVRQLQDLRETGEDALAQVLTHHIYDLALLNHRSLKGKDLQAFLERSAKLVEALSSKTLGKSVSFEALQKAENDRQSNNSINDAEEIEELEELEDEKKSS
jgi:molecular chaperone HtpG